MPRLLLSLLSLLLLALLIALSAGCASAQDDPAAEAEPPALPGFRTDTAQRSIRLSELKAGGPPKDGIPSIDDPRFVTPEAAAGWLEPQEPVVALRVGEDARAYPLQILTWHEIVNDVVGGVPVAVTFCPLCYSAVAYERTVGGEVLEFGVSGFLRHSDLVMFDRRTESLWQQLTGEALVGDHTGTTLTALPAQIVAFEQFREAYPEGRVLSRETGHARDYGRNPYAGYDDVDKRPFLYDGPEDGRLAPMERVVAVHLDGSERAYPHRLTAEERAVNDEAGGVPLVVFHAPGAVSALDAERIAASREVGTTGVFDRRLDGRALTFEYDDAEPAAPFVDAETGSRWDVTGRAAFGPLAGQRLAPIHHGDYFAFAWFAFRPETTVYDGARQKRAPPGRRGYLGIALPEEDYSRDGSPGRTAPPRPP